MAERGTQLGKEKEEMKTWAFIKNRTITLFEYLGIILVSIIGFFAILAGIMHLLKTYEVKDMASACPAAAILVTAIAAFLTLTQHRRNSEEAYIVIFRELHKEFWNDNEVKKARQLICCDDAYNNELLPVLKRTLNSEKENAEDYPKLESLDRFCAILLRIGYAADVYKTPKQQGAWRDLGFYYWFDKISMDNRIHIIEYLQSHWVELLDKHNSLIYLKQEKPDVTRSIHMINERSLINIGP